MTAVAGFKYSAIVYYEFTRTTEKLIKSIPDQEMVIKTHLSIQWKIDSNIKE